MANRYWVGGSGTWSTTSTTNWSATSGGAGGASVPTAADSVFFDQAGTYTVTCTGALTCLDITVSAGTVTFAQGVSPTFAISGSMSLLAGTAWNASGVITFNATTTGKTVTTNGVTLNTTIINFNGVGGGWTLGSALTTGSSQGVTVTAGSFNTGNYNITCGPFTISGTSTRSVTLGSSTISFGNGNTGTTWNATTITGLTFSAGTSTLTTAQSTLTFIGGGLTYYNLNIANGGASTKTITGANTYNDFAVAAPSTAGVTTVTFDSKQTINGTLSTTSTAGNRRVFFASATYGISVDLAVNSAPSLTDADFRGLYVTGTSAPISGTRIGNRGECRGITFSTPKTVYFVATGANWSGNNWSNSSGGAVSTDYFPLPQDTATINNSSNATLNIDFGYTSTFDASARTSAITVNFTSSATAYGDWKNGSGVTLAASSALTFSGGGTQTITSAGKTFSCPITVDTYGGTVQLADALNIGSQVLAVTNGTFDTKGYAVAAGSLSSSNSNVRTITLGSSTLTFSGTSPIVFTVATNLTFLAGTSIINSVVTLSGGVTTNLGGQTYNNFTFTNNSTSTLERTITGANTFNNLTLSGGAATANIQSYLFSANQTINGALTCAGTSAVRRVFLQSSAIGTQRDLTVGTLFANDCDFRDIEILGTAAGTAPTRAGDCGGNNNITFPSPKTVYWNLAGAANWSDTGWATSSGGSPAVNNFPLAQDTAVFDNTGSVTGTITIEKFWNIGTFDASNRTSAMTLTTSTAAPVVYGDWKFGTGVTSSSATGVIVFAKNGTQTITSNGVQFGCPVTVNHPSGTVQLADAISLNAARTLTLTTGTFDAVSYNVTTGLFAGPNTGSPTLKMGSGTWTLSGTGTVWNTSSASPVIVAGTSTIVLSDTSTAARTFAAGQYYNKLTIGGTTGISTLTIIGASTFGELASTKTVAHTILFASATIYNIGKWSVTGTVGNVVTVGPQTAATTYTISIAGPANSGIDYLSVSYCAVSTTSPGEFYVGANSTNTAGNTGAIIFTATPAPRTLYWVGGTGNWSSTTKWSTSSGGGSGAAIPTSLDAVNFDSASNATAYTATIDAGVTIARCASFTMAGPASGNVTFAGTVPIAFHGNVSFAATGITRSYTGAMNWAGNSSYTFTTNGLTLASAVTMNGIGATWTLGSALNIGANALTVTYGTFSTSASNYTLTASALSSNNSNIRSISLNGSTVTLSAISLTSFNALNVNNLTFNAGTSQINLSGSDAGVACGGLTFNDVSFTSGALGGRSITGANTFTTLSFVGTVQTGVIAVTFNANQTIGTLTLSAGTAAAYRTFLASDTIGTQRTLTVTTLTAGAADYDFRDIAVTGTAAPLTGTRFGDCKGNSGITFDAAKTVYWTFGGSANWGGNFWYNTPTLGTVSNGYFPLAQDTAIIPSNTLPSGNTITINANYNIGTIDMSARTSNTMTLATGTTTPAIYGNWINGTGTTLSGTGQMTFAGRGSQTITSAGKTFTQRFIINTPSGAVALQDAATFSNSTSNVIDLLAGTFDAAVYNVTQTSTGATTLIGSSATTAARTLAFGSGTWTFAATQTPCNISATNQTVSGTATLSFTSSAANKTFAGGGLNYSGITVNQGGSTQLIISGNNTFKDITNTYSATGASTINLGATTTTLTQFTGTGAAAKLLTLSGTSAASPATLILSSGTVTTPDYLSISNVRAYSLTDTWYAGANSTNLGSLGWIFAASGGTTYTGTILETSTATDFISASLFYGGVISETASATDALTTQADFAPSISETATGTDTLLGALVIPTAISELVTGTDTILGGLAISSAFADSATATDTLATSLAFIGLISEASTATDAIAAQAIFSPSISETATGTDVVASALSLNPTVSEAATATDVTTVIGTYNVATPETASATDVLTTTMVMLVSLADSASAADAVLGLNTLSTTINESGTVTDALTTRLTAIASLVETATATDAITLIGTFNVATLETATGTDGITVIGIYNVSLADQAAATDVFLGDYLWNPIDDSQTPDWGQINNTQSAVWVQISDTQTPNWQNVNNSQTTAWGEIDDSQNPGWVNIQQNP